MKVSKVFGCVLGLHFGVIAVLLVQPGCQSHQPPTKTYTQSGTSFSSSTGTGGSSMIAATPVQGTTTMRNYVRGASRSSDTLIQATNADADWSTSGASNDGLDAAFNAGFDGNDFGEFDDIAPIAPLSNSAGGQTVQVSGTSMETYTIKKGDSLWALSKRYNVSLNELYAANGLNKSSVLRIGQQIQIPVEGGSATVNAPSADTYQPSSFNQSSTSYTVKSGDSLSKIASQFGTSVRALKAANGKSSDLIRVGETLIVPVSGSSSSSGSAVSGSTVSTVSVAAPSVTYSAPSSSSARTHTVKSGEYPATIARKYGMTTGELLALNGITDPRKLQVGQVLKVSATGSAANVASRTETVVAPAAASSFSSASSTTLIPATSATTNTSSASANSANSASPVAIKIVEADPLIEGEVSEIQTDDMFEGAVEIPVIRLEE
jgi:LysM repeat protein